MLDAVRAETLKLARHRATWLMVWIYPIGVALLVAGQLIRDITGATVAPATAQAAAAWLAENTVVWNAPLSGVGRFLMAGFAALVFAGEYGWNTWKLIIPARRRWELIVAKWLTCALLVFTGFLAADLIGLLAALLRSAVGMTVVPDDVSAVSIISAHATAAVKALPAIAYTIVFAGLFAVLTTSLLASVILSVALIFVEQLLLPVGLLAYSYLPSVASALITALPLYHIANVVSWAKGSGLILPFDAATRLALSWPASLAVLLAWVTAAAAATLARFNRQDLN